MYKGIICLTSDDTFFKVYFIVTSKRKQFVGTVQ